MTGARWIAFAAGALLVVVTWASVMRTLVVPRASSSRIARTVASCVRRPVVWFANRSSDYSFRDRVLAPLPPYVLLCQLLSWLTLFFAGFALMFWPLTKDFGRAVNAAGSSLLTLGTVVPVRQSAFAVSFIAAVTGLIVVALQIGYLPTLYSAFNRREALVTTLQSRAGEPAWGPELLARHQIVGTLDVLGDFYGEWENWAADVAETHSNYPALVFFRSPQPLRSWVVGLLAVMDSAAIYLATCPSTAPTQARMCLRMGFTCLRDVCGVIGIRVDHDPLPTDDIALSYEDFLGGIERMQAVGFPMERTPEQAWPHFRGWRVNYESTAYAIARAVDAPPALWSGSRHLDAPQIAPIRPPNRTPEQPHRA